MAELPDRAVRMIFVQEGSELRLVSRIPVDDEVAPLDTAVAPEPGHLLDMRDNGGRRSH
jgi:hypothetical protein